MNLNLRPYDPCPCGSGSKYKFCCAAKAKEHRHGKYPIGTIAFYGPDDQVTTKVVIGVLMREGVQPILKRWSGENLDTNENVQAEMRGFLAQYGVKSIAFSGGNIGCPHEEGIDFSLGRDCPFCPFWAGKQGTARREDEGDSWLDDCINEQQAQELYGTGDLDDEDREESDELGGRQIDYDGSAERIHSILGDQERTFGETLDILCAHLKANLKMPCEVTGAEDFRWEEPYVFGVRSRREYEQLKRTQPSYSDCYELLDIDRNGFSEWMLFSDDLAAHVRRISDGKKFILGLAELEAIDETSPNHQLIEDYAVYFVNNR